DTSSVSVNGKLSTTVAWSKSSFGGPSAAAVAATLSHTIRHPARCADASWHNRPRMRSVPCGAPAGLLWAGTAAAQTAEIQVHDGGLAAPGAFNLTLHNNYVADGSTTPAFAGGVTADKSWNGAFEWAYGAAPWFEAGLYLPLYSHDHRQGWGVNGFKLRA